MTAGTLHLVFCRGDARILAEAPRHEATTIAANSRGAPWTLSGLDTAFQRLIAKLEETEAVSDGLTLHGLRHTLATRLKEAGVDEETRADLLGHNLAMSRHYSEEADTSHRDRKLIAAADLFGNGKRRGVAKRAGKSAKQRARDDGK
jgi:integrase